MCEWRNPRRTSERLNRRARSLASSRSHRTKDENDIVITVEVTPIHLEHSRKLSHQRKLLSTAFSYTNVRAIVVVSFWMSKMIQAFVSSDRRRIASSSYFSFILIYPGLRLTDLALLILTCLFVSHHNRVTSNTHQVILSFG